MKIEQKHHLIVSAIASIGILVTFVTLLFLQYQNVFFVHDDWGLATLSYSLSYSADQAPIHGTNYDLNSLISFLYDEYMNWSGRALSALLATQVFHLGLPAARITNVAILTLTCLLSVKAVTPRPAFSPVILVPTICFICFPEYIKVGGLYWFTASIVGLWGVVPLLLAGWRVRARGQFDEKSSLLLALSALFSEVWAVAAISFVLGLSLAEGPAQGYISSLRRNFMLAVPVIIAATLVILAPGNFHRVAISQYDHADIFGTFADNLETLLMGWWLKATIPFLMLLGLSCSSLIIAARRKKHLRERESVFLLASMWGAAVLAVIFPPAIFVPPSVFMIWLLVLIWVVVRGVNNGEYPAVLLAIILASLGSLGFLLIVSPYLSARSVIPFFCLLMPIVTFALAYGFIELKRDRIIRWSAFLIFLVTAAIGASSTLQIYRGYAANSAQHLYNSELLLKAGEALAAGELRTPTTLRLMRLKDDRYAEKMPYQRPLIEKWIKLYYDLPPEVEFVWVSTSGP